jgi:hypothetical protein
MTDERTMTEQVEGKENEMVSPDVALAIAPRSEPVPASLQLVTAVDDEAEAVCAPMARAGHVTARTIISRPRTCPPRALVIGIPTLI